MIYLAHHGVKDMHWGVRNGPPYPLSNAVKKKAYGKNRYKNPDGTLTEAGRKRYRDALQKESKTVNKKEELDDPEVRLADSYNKSGIIPKGTKSYRVSSSADVVDDKRKYVSLTTEGRNSYQGLYAELTLGNENAYDAINIEYEAIKDLKLASSEQVDRFIASLRPDKTKYTAILNDLDYLEQFGNEYSNTTKPSKLALEARQYMSDGRNYLYKARKEALFSTKYDEDNSIFKYFKDLGYDAISDVEDGGLGKGNYLAPVIILNPSGSLKEIARYQL